jgi:hypothetical protein
MKRGHWGGTLIERSWSAPVLSLPEASPYGAPAARRGGEKHLAASRRREARSVRGSSPLSAHNGDWARPLVAYGSRYGSLEITRRDVRQSLLGSASSVL